MSSRRDDLHQLVGGGEDIERNEGTSGGSHFSDREHSRLSGWALEFFGHYIGHYSRAELESAWGDILKEFISTEQSRE